ncbi:MAG: ornithine carbamoyltransferase [Planctomycetales bacterium]|nr:ornithine carbamoyltransferase [Planctomycetales bacterium]
MRHLLSLFDLSQQELHTVLSLAQQIKELLEKGQRPAWLERRVLAMLFEKPSLRTRVSFEAGMCQLGGSAMFLGEEVGWQSRESTADFVRVLAEYADYVVCRAKCHQSVVELARHNCLPIINGLTDHLHPCQALADILTMRQHTRSLAGSQVTFVGDGNNVARSLAIGCAMVGVRFRLLGPADYFISQPYVEEIYTRYPNADFSQTSDFAAGLREADFIYTDVWTSMGQEAESQTRREAFGKFQLNSKLLSLAPRECKILHCLPARRGEEITDDVMDCPNSLVVEQAGNRMHAQKGLLVWLALQHGQLSASDLLSAGIELPLGIS